MKPRTIDSLESRVARLERCLGSLLIFLAAQDLLGPEDFAILQGVRRPLGHEPAPPAPIKGVQPEVPF